MIYYELRLYRSRFYKFSNTDRIENLSIEKTNTSLDQNYLFGLSAKITSMERIGDDLQNFILSIVSRKDRNNEVELNEEEVINMEDLNKYLFK